MRNAGLREAWTLKDWQAEAFYQQEKANSRKTEIAHLKTNLNAANQLLEQTIEVLKNADRCLRYLHTFAQWTWLQTEAKPLLDKLQALKKEGTDG